MYVSPSARAAGLVLLLGAATQAAPALDHGSQTPRASHARLRRDSLSAHASRSTIVENLRVYSTNLVDAESLSTIDPATSAPWTGFAADGGEIEMMPARLLVSFELHGEPQLLDVTRTDAFVSPNCRFPFRLIKLQISFTFRGLGVSYGNGEHTRKPPQLAGFG